MRQSLSCLCAALLAALAVSCDRRGREVRLGGVASLTGTEATFGQSNRNGYQLAIQEWNDRGGVLGQPVRLILADDKGDAGEGATLFTKLIQRDKVAAILGATSSKVSMAGAPIAQAARVPMLTPTSTNPKVTQVGDYVFRACFTDAFQGVAAARFAHEDLKVRRIGCLFDLGNDYAVDLARTFTATFTGLGGQMTAQEGHASGVLDFRAQLTKILGTQPDLLYLNDYYGDAALAAKQARELGFKGLLLGADGWDSPQLLALGGAALEKGYFTTHCAKDDPDPTVQAFVLKYRSRYHADPDFLAVLAYDAGNILLDAIHRAGSTQGQAVRDALASTDLKTVSGQVRFDAQRNPIKPLCILEIKDGRQVFRAKVAP